MKEKKNDTRLLYLLMGIFLCGGCNSVLQQEQAAVDRLGAPNLVTIQSGDIAMFDNCISQTFLSYKKTWKDSERRYYYLDAGVVIIVDSRHVVIVSIDSWQYDGVRNMLEKMSQNFSTQPVSKENGKNEK